MEENQIGLTLRFLRLRNGFTAEEVAREIGKPQTTVSNWERGRGHPDVLSLLALCRLYGVTDVYSAFGEASPAGEKSTSVAVFGQEQKVLDAYRKADLGTKRIIEKILDVPAESEKVKNA